nr:CheR family methyltransferase [Methylibium sp.]
MDKFYNFTCTALERDHVYVIAPGVNLVTDDGHVQPAVPSGRRRPSTAIDVFFRALADVHLERAMCVVLSGTGSDGAIGVGRVKEMGGLSVAQAPQEAQFAQMPRSAIDTGLVDLVLPAAEIGPRLVELWHLATNSPVAAAEPTSTPQDPFQAPKRGAGAEGPVAEILSLLRFHTRHDFRHYKRSTVLRRIARRMQVNGAADLLQYRDFLAGNPQEAVPLLQDMLISVTNFFRNPEAFAVLQREVVPQLFEGVRSGEDLRAWVVGCATGEEGYSIAMLLQEAAERRAQPVNVQIFATDINEAALAVARRGTYPAAIAADVSTSRLTQFFEQQGEEYRVVHSVRDPVLFAKHNLLGDPPFSKLDLVCCRNVLIYLDTVAQAAALETFAYALKPGGFLFLGDSESADSGGDLFTPVDKARRIFRANAGAIRTPRVAFHSPTPFAQAPRQPAPVPVPGESADAAMLQHQLALLNVSAPSALINGEYEILHMSPGAAEFVGRSDGVPSDNLLANVAPDVRVELRAALFKAEQTQCLAHARVEREADGKQRELSIAVHPVQGTSNEPRRWLIVFEPWRGLPTGVSGVTADEASEGLLERLQADNKELKSQLQDTLDRFAVSAEEYKAANEELQAINEELRSATEELETSREELESMNEELGTVNFELRVKVDDAAQVNDDLKNLMSASDIATVFVDSGLRIKRFTPQATRLFHLIPSDIGRPLTDIRSRLRFDEIGEDAATAFKELRAVERQVESVEGRRYLARALPYRTTSNKIEGAVLTFVDLSEQLAAQDRAREAEDRLMRAIMVNEDFAVMTTDESGVITTWNLGAEAIFGYRPEDIIGRNIDQLFVPSDRAAGAPAVERRTALDRGRAEDERWHVRANGTTFFCSGVVTPLQSGSGAGFVKIARDVSEAKQMQLGTERELRDQRHVSAGAQIAGEVKDKFLAVMSHELKQPLNLIQVNAELLTRLPEAQSIAPIMRIGQTIQRAISAQTKIVDDLLDLSRIQTGKLSLAYEDVDLLELTHTLGQALAGDMEKKGVAFTMTLGATPLLCHCDRVRVEQIIWNLLGNAAKFTPSGGRISVDLCEDGDYLKLSITDTGNGIAPEFLPRVFEMFSQASQPTARGGTNSGGLGIGLALVDELARAHGGRVDAQSEGLGRGTTFVLTLPLHRPAGFPPPAPQVANVGLAGARVLAVDDDHDSLSTFAMLLQYEGAVVDIAPSGKEALALLAAKTYDVLISDVGMPEMDGFELVAAARKLSTRHRLLAIAVTGYGRDVDIRKALEAGFDAHVAKPVSMAQLQTALHSLGGPPRLE